MPRYIQSRNRIEHSQQLQFQLTIAALTCHSIIHLSTVHLISFPLPQPCNINLLLSIYIYYKLILLLFYILLLLSPHLPFPAGLKTPGSCALNSSLTHLQNQDPQLQYIHNALLPPHQALRRRSPHRDPHPPLPPVHQLHRQPVALPQGPRRHIREGAAPAPPERVPRAPRGPQPGPQRHGRRRRAPAQGRGRSKEGGRGEGGPKAGLAKEGGGQQEGPGRREPGRHRGQGEQGGAAAGGVRPVGRDCGLHETGPDRGLLKVVLPVLEARQGAPDGKVQHRARAADRGAGPARARARDPGRAREEDGPPHGAQCHDLWPEHRRERRHPRPGVGGHAGGHHQEDGRQEDPVDC